MGGNELVDPGNDLRRGAALLTVMSPHHSTSIQVTADIYTTVPPAGAHRAVENTAALLFVTHKARQAAVLQMLRVRCMQA